MEISAYYSNGRTTKKMLSWINRLWWEFMPGVEIKVLWPNGEVTVDEDHPLWDWTIGPSKYIVESADPNDHYRPELERKVGRQGWDWDWCFKDNDIAENRLTIKFRKSKARWATYFALKWN